MLIQNIHWAIKEASFYTSAVGSCICCSHWLINKAALAYDKAG